MIGRVPQKTGRGGSISEHHSDASSMARRWRSRSFGTGGASRSGAFSFCGQSLKGPLQQDELGIPNETPLPGNRFTPAGYIFVGPGRHPGHCARTGEGARYRVRTCDLPRVKRTLYR